MKKALITGADGFIGSHLTEMLVLEGYKVKALSHYNSFNNWGWLEDVSCKDKIQIISGDIRDPHFCKHITKDVDIIFHLAAESFPKMSFDAPLKFYDTNVKGTQILLEEVKDCKKINPIIHICSSSEVFGKVKKKYLPIKESCHFHPASPYAISKVA